MGKKRSPYELYLPATRIEVQPVKNGHSSECKECGELPEGRRLALRTGSGRWAKSEILCVECGKEWLQQQRTYLTNAGTLLATGQGHIRPKKVRE